MAILRMQKISVFALRRDRKAILETLQRKGVVEITDIPLCDSVFSKDNTSVSQAGFRKNSAAAKQALEITEQYVPSKKSMLSAFEGREIISKDQYYENVAKSSEIMKDAFSIINLSKSIAQAKASVISYSQRIESLKPWLSLDVSMRFKGTKSTAAFIGTLPELWDETKILTELSKSSNEEIPYEVEIVSASSDFTCVFIVTPLKYKQKAETALRQIGFAKPTVDSKHPPREQTEILQKKIDNLSKEIEESENQIKSYADKKNLLKFMQDYYIMRADKYEIIEKLSNTKHVFVLTGYIVKDNAQKLLDLLVERFDAHVELSDSEDTDTPVALKNNSFSEPVESVLKTYSLPKRSEIDPTSIMAVFYYVFFGLMFSDAGYGLVMSLACGIVLKRFKNMEQSLRKAVKMFFYCGISTVFWGLMFGSFFGDAVSVICQTFLGMSPQQVPLIPGITTPMWFNPVTDPMRMLMIAFLFGIIHLFFGLGLQGYMHIRNGHFKYFIYDVLSWYLLVSGGILALLSLDMMKDIAGFILPPQFLTIGGIMALVGAVIILLFSGRESKNPVKRLLKGAYGLYGATGYLSDILSYSRLLALGLATGVIAQVFNQIGSMFGGSVLGLILFSIIFIVGHAINIGINALGAYVHTNRLQFVEFFGKFYEGGGREFKPFKINTKHYNIKEEL